MTDLCNKLFLVFSVYLSFCWFGCVHCFEEAHTVFNTHGICATFVWNRGYDCTEFIVPTKDGFLLSVQKMWKNRTLESSFKGHVFLHHGLREGGEAWLLNDPQQSLAFMLADSGFGVWIGNGRTSSFTYGHIIYNRTQQEFWDWKWDDLVEYDVPSMLKFVNHMSGQPIYYVGYSQGAMSGFAAFTNHEISRLVKKAAMMSPVAYLNHVSSPLIRTAAFLFLDQVELLLNNHEFNLSSAPEMQFLQTTCKNAHIDFHNLITGPSCCINKSLTTYYEKYKQSTSMKNIAQLAQLMRSGKFRKYDYGIMENMLRYGRSSPPSYNLSAIPKNLSFFLAHGGKDPLADSEDVSRIAKQLPGNVTTVFMPNYSHGDMMYATSANIDVYSHILEFFH